MQFTSKKHILHSFSQELFMNMDRLTCMEIKSGQANPAHMSFGSSNVSLRQYCIYGLYEEV